MTVTNMRKINKKIPGLLPPPIKREAEKLTDLHSKTIAELLELRDRQSKLLKNKNFISRLPDKGVKIQALLDKIVSEIKLKAEEEQACNLLQKLSLGVDKQTVESLEWQSKVSSRKSTHLDSDDDSEPEDVIHILSQSTALEKITKVLKPENPLITAEELVKLEEIPHIRYIVEKTEVNAKPSQSGHFKPFKTTKSNVHDPEKEKLRKKHKNWEVTAATPPPIVHCPAKVLNIEESLKLQKEYNLHLKEVEAQHATAKLLERRGFNNMHDYPKTTVNFTQYREPENDADESDPEGSDKEVHDEEPDRGGVFYTVMK